MPLSMDQTIDGPTTNKESHLSLLVVCQRNPIRFFLVKKSFEIEGI